MPPAGDGGPDATVVKAFFETDTYLRGNPLIPVRARLVASLLGGIRGGHILDLGCGDGAVSRPLLAADNQLTLVDFSTAMLERARQATPPDAAVEFVLADVLSYRSDASFDAVLCIGVLAHVPAVESMIARVSQALKLGGVCVLQITDDENPLGWILNRYQRLRARRSAYRLNTLARSDVIAIAQRHGLTFTAAREYALSIPGSGYLPNKLRFGLETRFADSPLLSRAGAETLISFQRRAVRESNGAAAPPS